MNTVLYYSPYIESMSFGLTKKLPGDHTRVPMSQGLYHGVVSVSLSS